MLAALTITEYGAGKAVWRSAPRHPDSSEDERVLSPGVSVNWDNRANLDQPPMSLFVGEKWHFAARCFSAGLEMFFGNEADDNPRLKPTVLARAQALCRDCPVATRCLTSALQNDERYGVWGGTSGRTRDKMRARITAGEPMVEVVDSWLASL